MRQKNETATSFKELKEITLAIQAQKNSAQTSDNANTSELTSQSVPILLRDNSQASTNERLKSEQGDKQGDNANAFKSDEKNTRGQE